MPSHLGARAGSGRAALCGSQGAARSRRLRLLQLLKTTNDLNFPAQNFTRAVIGTNNIDCCNRT